MPDLCNCPFLGLEETRHLYGFRLVSLRNRKTYKAEVTEYFEVIIHGTRKTP